MTWLAVALSVSIAAQVEATPSPPKAQSTSIDAAATKPPYFRDLSRKAIGPLTVGRDGGPVILIIVDALRPDHLSPYGFKRQTSPNLERLADEGVIFTNYFVNSNWTRPSTASLLTGLLPASHGVERESDRLADEFVTLAETLKQVGIPTGAVVGNGNAGSAFGLGRGFAYYADTVKHWRGLPNAEQVMDLAVPFVEQHKSEPFFLMLFLVDTHDPYHAPPPYEMMFVDDPSVPLVRTPHWERGQYTKAQIDRMKATYDGAIRYTDSVLGKFFDKLRALGVYDKATFIITADHGEAFGEHGNFLHSHHLHDEIIRAPLIVRAPTMSQQGGYYDGLVQSIDILPTLAHYYDAPVDKRLPGSDVFARLAIPHRLTSIPPVITEFNNFGIRRRTVRTQTHKVVLDEPADAREFKATVGNRHLLPSVSFTQERIHFFDLQKDPFERHNLYSKANERLPEWSKLLTILRNHEPRAVVRSRPPVAEHIDAETRADLRALGYIQ